MNKERLTTVATSPSQPNKTEGNGSITPYNHAKRELLAGDWVRNGTSKPGQITEVVELKPGYPRAWVVWEGSNFPVAEDVKVLKLIEAWALDWQWNDNNKFIRLHDNKNCNNLQIIVSELDKLKSRFLNAQLRSNKELIEELEAKIQHLKKLKVKAIVIDNQFSSLIPKSTQDERSQLKELLREEGCTHALVVWNNILLDGHNRFKLCQELKIDFEIDFRQFEDRKAAHDWIIKTQLGRRNISDDWFSNLRGQMYNSTKSARGGDRGNQYTKAVIPPRTSYPVFSIEESEISRDTDSTQQTARTSQRTVSQNRFAEGEETSDVLFSSPQDMSTKVKTSHSFSPAPVPSNKNIADTKEVADTAETIGDLYGVNARTIKRDGKYASAIDKICRDFGQEWRDTIINSKLTKTQVKEIAKYVDDENFYEEIEAILSNVSHGDDFKENYQLFKKKINPPVKLVQGQLVKIKFKHKSGLTNKEKHSNREYGLIVEILEYSYRIKLLGDREVQLKREDLEGIELAEYAVSFSPEEFEKLTSEFGDCRQIEEELKKGLDNR